MTMYSLSQYIGLYWPIYLYHCFGDESFCRGICSNTLKWNFQLWEWVLFSESMLHIFFFFFFKKEILKVEGFF